MTAGPSSPPTETARVLAVCDGLLREIGRRQHRFSWLRDPDAPDDGWLVVDGYYPANKLVVYCGDDANQRRLHQQLVPQHGLYLLTFDPAELPDDPIAAQAIVRKQLEGDGWSPRPESNPVAAVSPPAAKPGPWTPVRTSAPAAAPQTTTAGFGMGLALSLIVLLEAYLGLVVLAFDHGDPVLGLGLVLDAAARVVGTLTTKTWSSLLIGSPEVAGHEQPGKAVAITAIALTGLGIVLAVL